MICENCGKELLDDSSFCPYCGTKVEKPQDPIPEPIEEKPAFCKNCGKEILKDATFCSYCGSSIIPTNPQEPAPALRVKTVFCRNCGKGFSNLASVCPHCGTKVALDNSANVAYSYRYQEYPRVDNRPVSGFCIAGFVVSIVSWFITLLCLVPLTGFILSLTGMQQADKFNMKYKALGFAGLIVSGVALFFSVYSMIAYQSFLTAFYI